MPEKMQEVRQSTELLKQIIRFFGQYQIAATPVNYTVCYEYFQGGHLLLSQAIDKTIKDRVRINCDMMQSWFETFLLGYDLKDLQQSQTDLSRITKQLHFITAQAEENVTQFDNSLNDCKNELNETTNATLISSVVSQLLSSTSSMQVAMEQMKQQMKDSKQEIASLHDRLEMATEEALTDPLTGLINRKGLSISIDEALTIAQQTQKYPCLLMLDIDHFKKINDTFGHLLGDKAIKMVAETLKKQIKGKDTATRYGGEEFCVLLPETEIQNAWSVAENIRRTIERMSIKRAKDKQEICRMTISIGIARYQPGEAITDFIGRADNALYESKNTGRNKVTARDMPNTGHENSQRASTPSFSHSPSVSGLI